MYRVHFFPIDGEQILIFACRQERTEREEAEKRHENRQAQNVNTASERKTESEGPDIIALPPPPPFSRKQTEPLKVFAFLSRHPSAKCRMICLSNGHHISNSSNPSQQTTGSMRGFIGVKKDMQPCALVSSKYSGRAVLGCRHQSALWQPFRIPRHVAVGCFLILFFLGC